jgi:RNA polymerase sigma factor (sigma-70 family)
MSRGPREIFQAAETLAKCASGLGRDFDFEHSTKLVGSLPVRYQMKKEFHSDITGGAQFHTTRWTLVIASAQSQAEGGKAALAELCRLYWYPLYAFARRRGRSPHDAQDLTQGFFMYLLEHRSLTRVDRLKGKFRSFLLASFQNYLSNEAQRTRSLKRGGSNEFISLDWKDAESRYRLEPADYLTAEKIYDARWAMTLLRQVMDQLRERYIAQGKRSTFEALQVYLRVADEKNAPSYDEVAKTLRIAVPAVKTLIHRLRKQYTAILREEVGRTVADPADIDGEIHSLCDALIAAEGRIAP